MTLTIFDHTSAITLTATPEQALALVGQLPEGIRVRVRPDDPFRVLSTSVPSTCTEPHPPGYFGLAVAQAYDIWGTPRATDEEYQAYLRGERPDPRD
jgi:hypothetical protein